MRAVAGYRVASKLKLMSRFHELCSLISNGKQLQKRTAVPAQTRPRRHDQQRIIVKSVAQPEIDMDKLARVIHLYTQQTASLADGMTSTSVAN